jgi:putative transcriptional regulator
MAKRIRVKVFEDLRQSLADARTYEQGKAVNLRTTEIPPPPRPLKPAEIRRIRVALNASQAIFARFLNVSPNTVESWEQGVRRPDQAALKLLTIAKKHPEAVLSTW